MIGDELGLGNFIGMMGGLVIAMVFLVLAIPLMGGLFEVGFDAGTGTQIGYISEIENNGVFWTPTEVRLISIEPTFSEYDTSWAFGVEDPEITEKARTYMRTHDKIVVSYQTYPFAGKWEYSHRTLITDIRLATAE